mmetsp:Transcript_1334/g.3480  ORF Transcript_1334/g.3480 Transcript_1334/m.3480 type:complete len:301 (-) Transcript_1334:487-1389(-)
MNSFLPAKVSLGGSKPSSAFTAPFHSLQQAHHAPHCGALHPSISSSVHRVFGRLLLATQPDGLQGSGVHLQLRHHSWGRARPGRVARGGLGQHWGRRRFSHDRGWGRLCGWGAALVIVIVILIAVEFAVAVILKDASLLLGQPGRRQHRRFAIPTLTINGSRCSSRCSSSSRSWGLRRRLLSPLPLHFFLFVFLPGRPQLLGHRHGLLLLLLLLLWSIAAGARLRLLSIPIFRLSLLLLFFPFEPQPFAHRHLGRGCGGLGCGRGRLAVASGWREPGLAGRGWTGGSQKMLLLLLLLPLL